MDLDMIQDLLGGSNLPPPPSVEDLLGDVVPVAHSPSPPPSPLVAASPPPEQTVRDVSVEHSYSKAATEEGVEPMDQDTVQQSPGSHNLAELSSDCYEAFLLNLLHVYTQNKMDNQSSSAETGETALSKTSTGQPDQKSNENSVTSSSTTSSMVEGGRNSEVFTIGSISPDAITALSQEQIQSLVTSNSANYDVVHKILAFRQGTEGGSGGGGGGGGVSGRGGAGGGGGGVGEGGRVGAAAVGGGGSAGGGGGVGQKSKEEEKDEMETPGPQLKLSSEQLKQIQLQMEEMIRTKQIVLPTDLSLEKQQLLLQSLILKQIHSQHLSQPPQTTASTQQTQATPTNQPIATPTPSRSVAMSNQSPTVGSTLASILQGDTGVDREEGGGSRAVKLEVPPPSQVQSSGSTKSVSLQLNPNPVAKTEESSPAAATAAASSSGITTRSGGGGGRKKKDSKPSEEPKKPSSPYGVFFSDVYPSVLQANPKLTLAEASKLISAMWNAMGLDTKKDYHERSEKQKVAYQAYVSLQNSETTPADVPEPLAAPKVEPATSSEREPGVAVTATERLGQNISTPSGPTPQAPPPPPPPTTGNLKLLVKDVKHCMNSGCFKDAVYTEFRGPRYCSNECVVQHCKSVFQEWVSQRKVAT